mgnify:CR=1 FL=1
MELFEKILEKYENKRIKRDCKALMKKIRSTYLLVLNHQEI